MPRVLITGANRGIGLEFTRYYASKGWNVLAAARNPVNVKEWNDLGLEKTLTLDVSDERSIKAMTVTIGNDTVIDVIINNAGILLRDTFADATKENLLQSVNVNSIGPFLVSRALIGNLKLAAANGNVPLIANVTSRMGSIGDGVSGAYYGYRMSKTALNMITATMAQDLKSDGICAIVVHPGFVKTGMTGNRGSLTTSKSVEHLVKIIERCTMADSGKFFHYEGQELPW